MTHCNESLQIEMYGQKGTLWVTRGRFDLVFCFLMLLFWFVSFFWGGGGGGCKDGEWIRRDRKMSRFGVHKKTKIKS